MGENWYKWLSVLFFSMFKFLGGPLAGISMGLSIVETIIFTVLGMMTSVLIFSTAGSWIREKFQTRFQKNKKMFSKKKRNIVKIWKKYGLNGVAFLTPLVFTPIIGTMVVVSFGVPIKKIFIVMLIAAIFWAIPCTLFLYYAGRAIGIVE